MRQGHDAIARQQFGVDGRRVLEDVEAGSRDLSGLDQASQLILVDDLTARRVDDIGRRLQQLQPARREQMIGGRGVGAIDRDDIHAGEHLVQAVPIGCLELLLDLLGQAPAVVIVDLQPECLGALRHRLADTAHADDAKAFAVDAMSQHPRRRPAGPVLAWIFQQSGPFREPARHRQDQRHGHIGGVFRQYARCVGDDDAAVARCIEIYVVHAGTKIRDQLELRSGLGNQGAIDLVRDSGNQDLRDLDRLGEFGPAHGSIVEVDACVEQLPHAGFHGFRQLACDDDQRFLGGCRHGCSSLAELRKRAPLGPSHLQIACLQRNGP